MTRSASRLIAAGVIALTLAAAAMIGSYVVRKRRAADARELPVVALPSGPISVLLIGDSRIARWPKPLLPAGCAVIGYGGATARNIRTVAERTIPAAKPDTVVIQAGYNDAVAAALGSPAEARAIMARAHDSITDIVSAARRSGARRTLVLTVAPPLTRDFAWRLLYGDRVERHLEELNRRIARLRREGVTVIDVRPMLLDGNDKIDPRFAADVSHFSEPAYRRLAQAVFGAEFVPAGRTCAR